MPLKPFKCALIDFLSAATVKFLIRVPRCLERSFHPAQHMTTIGTWHRYRALYMCGSFFSVSPPLLWTLLVHSFTFRRNTEWGDGREGLCKRCKWCLREGCIVFLGTAGTVSCKLAHKLFKNFFHPSRVYEWRDFAFAPVASLHERADDKALELFVMRSCDKMPQIECKSVRVFVHDGVGRCEKKCNNI